MIVLSMFSVNDFSKGVQKGYKRGTKWEQNRIQIEWRTKVVGE